VAGALAAHAEHVVGNGVRVGRRAAGAAAAVADPVGGARAGTAVRYGARSATASCRKSCASWCRRWPPGGSWWWPVARHGRDGGAAHQSLIEHWPNGCANWLAADRDFLAWRAELGADQRRWQAAAGTTVACAEGTARWVSGEAWTDQPVGRAHRGRARVPAACPRPAATATGAADA